MTIAELAKKYPYIVAYGRWMGSYDYYIENQLLAAERTNAPREAYARKNTDTGNVLDEWYVARGSESWAKNIKVGAQ